MCGHGDGSLTKRGSQGAYVLLALRRDACGASSPPSQIREPTILAEGSNLAGEPPRSAAKDFRAVGPPKARSKHTRQLEHHAACHARQSWPSITAPCPASHGPVEPDPDCMEAGRRHSSGLALAALSQQPPPPTDQSTNREAFPPLPEFRAHLEKCRASSQEGKARFAGLSTSLEYAALLRVCREQDVHCIRKVGRHPRTPSFPLFQARLRLPRDIEIPI